MRKVGFTTAFLAALVAIMVLGTQTIGAGSNKSHVKSDAMIGYQETPGVSSPASGTFEATIDDDSRTITFVETYVGLTAPAVQSHVHFGNRFNAGGVSFFLCGGGTKPPCPPGTATEAVVTGTVTPADVIGPANQGIAPGEWDEIVAAMRAGEAYANVHTTPFPAGEIRGQINDDNQRQP